MIILKIIFVIACAILFRLGGWDKAKWSGYGDILIPLLIALYFWNFWLFLTYLTIKLGYGSISPDDDKPSFLAKLLNDHKGWKTRGIWGLLVATIGSLPLLLWARLSVLHYIYYIILNSLINAGLSKLNAKDIIHEPAAGVCIGSIVFLV